ncbi:MAG: hypothetical protein ACI9MJ_002709, partial [Alphaproteobacteria bacterium]
GQSDRQISRRLKTHRKYFFAHFRKLRFYTAWVTKRSIARRAKCLKLVVYRPLSLMQNGAFSGKDGGNIGGNPCPFGAAGPKSAAN